MSYNQFLTVRISGDGKSLAISGTTEDLTPVKSIDVAVAKIPADGSFPEILAKCEFHSAETLDAAALKNPWSATYTMTKPGEFTDDDRVLVTGRATYANAIDVWAETEDVLGEDEEPSTATSPE